MLEAFFDTDRHFGRKTLALTVDRGADRGRKSRVEERLATDDDKDPARPGIPLSGATNTVKLTALHGSSW